MTKQELWLEEKIWVVIKLGFDTLPKIISELFKRYPSCSEQAIRQMVWRMIDRGQLRLTINRTIEAV